MLAKDNSVLSEIVYATRTGTKTDRKAAFEKQYGRDLNTVRSKIVSEFVNKEKGVLEHDSEVSFKKSDFEEDRWIPLS